MVEIVDTAARENYNKIVIHKKKWVPISEGRNYLAGNYFEIEKPSHADDDLIAVKPPRLLKIQGTQMRNNLKPALPPKPAVPPKPVLCKNLGHNIPGRHAGKMVNDTNMIRCNHARNNDDSFDNITNTRTAKLKSKTETKEVGNKPKRERENNLCNKKHELLERMKTKVKILGEDKQEIKNELLENEEDINRIVDIVEDHGSIIDADKLRVHIKELESVTRLKTVLTVREETAQTKMKITTDATEKELLERKISKLSSQIEEADKLQVFRARRGEAVLRSLINQLDNGNLQKLKNLLEIKENLLSEVCKVEEKIQLGQQQIKALDNTVILGTK